MTLEESYEIYNNYYQNIYGMYDDNWPFSTISSHSSARNFFDLSVFFSSSANDFSVAASSFSSAFSITPFCRRSNDRLTTSSNPMCIFASIGFASEISRLTAHDLPAVQNSSLDYLQPLHPGSGSCPCLSRYLAPSLQQQLSGRTVPAAVPEILYGV